MMKNQLKLAFALLGLIAFSSADAHIVVLKQRGGENGYDRVVEQHDDVGNSSLECTDPGTSSCSFVVPPSTGGVYKVTKATAVVEGYIKSGTVSGTTTVDGSVVKWSGTDIYNYTMSID